MLKASFIALQR